MNTQLAIELKKLKKIKGRTFSSDFVFTVSILCHEALVKCENGDATITESNRLSAVLAWLYEAFGSKYPAGFKMTQTVFNRWLDEVEKFENQPNIFLGACEITNVLRNMITFMEIMLSSVSASYMVEALQRVQKDTNASHDFCDLVLRWAYEDLPMVFGNTKGTARVSALQGYTNKATVVKAATA